MEEDNNGWDMFCGDHFEESKENIQKKYPECDVGWCDTIRDEEFDDDESMRCGHLGCTKESKYEIYWMKFDAELDLKSSKYVPLDKDTETIEDV